MVTRVTETCRCVVNSTVQLNVFGSGHLLVYTRNNVARTSSGIEGSRKTDVSRVLFCFETSGHTNPATQGHLPEDVNPKRQRL
jgi:hypothetical protein